MTFLAIALDRNWRQSAACRDADPDVFFSEAAPGSEAYARDAAEALSTCAACPVRAECAAVSASEPWGIWAGTTEGERGNAAQRERARRFRERRAVA
jgi:WhiB family redox-sensing transcriptional regulator